MAEDLHFARAAARLGIAQPALSQQLAALEKRLGCKLLLRRPRVALTDAGRVLLSEARKTLAQAESAIEAAKRAGRGETGALAVGFAASAVLSRFPQIVRRYRERYPEVSLTLRELSPAEEIEAVSSRHVDVAFVRETAPGTGLDYRRIENERLVVLLPATHPLTGRKTIRAEALAGESFVHFPRDMSPALYDQILAVCEGAGFRPRVIQEVREWLTGISLVQSGLGVAIVPDTLMRLRPAGAVFRPLAGTSGRGGLFLCHLKSGASPATMTFAAIATEVLER